MTQNQIQELLEGDQARTLVEGAEERGWIEPAEFEAFALEHELNEQEIEDVTREFERIGLEVGRPQAAADDKADEKAQETHVLSGSAVHSLRAPSALFPRLFFDRTCCHPTRVLCDRLRTRNMPLYAVRTNANAIGGVFRMSFRKQT